MPMIPVGAQSALNNVKNVLVKYKAIKVNILSVGEEKVEKRVHIR